MKNRKHHKSKWRTLGRFLLLAGISLLIIGTTTAPARAQTKEYKLKLAFLYNFTKYLQFPDGTFENAESPFVIGILGNDPFGSALIRVAERRRAQQRQIKVVRYTTEDEISGCHILFIASNINNSDAETVISATQGQPIFIVGDNEGIARRGGILNFYRKADETLGMKINVQEARKRSLVINAKLLSLAKIVETQ